MFPRIERPCPYKANLAAVMDGDFCRACQRTVFDLTALDEGERRAFLAGCGEGEVCVSYRVPRPAIAAAALAAMAFVPGVAAAQEVAQAAVVAEDYDYSQEIVVGGVGAIHDPDAPKTAAAEPVAAEELPVTYEDQAERPAPTR